MDNDNTDLDHPGITPNADYTKSHLPGTLVYRLPNVEVKPLKIPVTINKADTYKAISNADLILDLIRSKRSHGAGAHIENEVFLKDKVYKDFLDDMKKALSVIYKKNAEVKINISEFLAKTEDFINNLEGKDKTKFEEKLAELKEEYAKHSKGKENGKSFEEANTWMVNFTLKDQKKQNKMLGKERGNFLEKLLSQDGMKAALDKIHRDSRDSVERE